MGLFGLRSFISGLCLGVATGWVAATFMSMFLIHHEPDPAHGFVYPYTGDSNEILGYIRDIDLRPMASAIPAALLIYAAGKILPSRWATHPDGTRALDKSRRSKPAWFTGFIIATIATFVLLHIHDLGLDPAADLVSAKIRAIRH